MKEVKEAGFTCMVVPKGCKESLMSSAGGLGVIEVSCMADLLTTCFVGGPLVDNPKDLCLKLDEHHRVGRATTWTIGLYHEGETPHEWKGVDDAGGKSEGEKTKDEENEQDEEKGVEDEHKIVASGFSPLHVDCAIYPGTGQVLVTGQVRAISAARLYETGCVGMVLTISIEW